MKRKGQPAKGYWRPLEFCPPEQTHRPEAIIAEAMNHYKIGREEAVAKLNEWDAQCKLYVNHLYQVQVFEREGELVLINVRRRDGAPIHDWRDLQRIKNEILGPECEAVELYPAESRLVDTSNKFHLWGSRDPSFRFPFGYKTRDVQDTTGGKVPTGLRQRRLT